MEIWKDIKGYEYYYQISNYGNVRSKERLITYSNGKKCMHKSKLRKASKNEYRIIILSKNSIAKGYKISRLVAHHFLPKVKGKNIVNHKDGNKYNDNVNNLEWCTRSENNLHAFETNLSKKVNEVSGVFYQESRKKWASYLYRNSKNIFIGRFETKEEAIRKRQIKLDEYNSSN